MGDFFCFINIDRDIAININIVTKRIKTMTDENDLEEEFEEKLIKDRVTQKLLQWVRVLLPLILGGIGWYVSAVISPMDERIIKLEDKCDVVRQFVATSENNYKHVTQLLKNMDAQHIRDIKHNTEDIDKLEAEVYRNGK